MVVLPLAILINFIQSHFKYITHSRLTPLWVEMNCSRDDRCLSSSDTLRLMSLRRMKNSYRTRIKIEITNRVNAKAYEIF